MNRRYQRLSLSRVSPFKSNQLKSNQLNLTQHKSNQIKSIKCWFLRRGENRSTRRKTSRSRVENQQSQPTYDAESGNRTRATLVGGECSDTAPSLLPIIEHSSSWFEMIAKLIVCLTIESLRCGLRHFDCYTAGLHQAMMSPWLVLIGAFRSSPRLLLIGGFRSSSFLRRSALVPIGCCVFFIVGIRTSGISIPLSLLTLSGSNLM